MLHLRKSFELPHLQAATHTLALSPLPVDDDDELLQDIAASHEEAWNLGDVDSRALESFWTEVQDDLKNDPTWFDFANDDE